MTFTKTKKVTKIDDKYFIGYNDNDFIRPLCIKLPQITGYVNKGNTTISFKISDKQLLKMCNQIWKRVEKLLKIESDSELVYGDNDKKIYIYIFW